MVTKVAIHQPNYFPWIGYFQKISFADIFIILDNVQFSKDSFTQRTKIRTKDGWMWLTIPIEKKYHRDTIENILLPEDNKWKKKHWMSIISNYSRSKYYQDHQNFFEELYSDNLKRLQLFNEKGILYLMDNFELDVDIHRASEFDLDDLRSTDLLVELVKSVGGDCYISGKGGEKYMIESKFKEENIKLEYFKFEPFEYPQRWDGFMPYMSAIDMLFNAMDIVPKLLQQKKNNIF